MSKKWSDGNLYPLGIDVSHWNGDINWSVLRGSPIKWAAAKCGELSYTDQRIEDTQDSQWAKNVQGAYDAGIPIGGYYMHNPQYYVEGGSSLDWCTVDADKQILCLRKWLEHKKIYFLALDLERWWQDYQSYAALKSAAPRVTPFWILRSVRHHLNNVKIAMARGYISNVPIVLYSARWFIEGYTKHTDGSSLYDVTPSYPVWEALYPDNTSETITNWDKLAEIMPPDTAKPTGLNGDLYFWQFSDRKSLPGIGKVDTNVSMKPLSVLYSWMKFEPATSPVAPPVTPPANPGTDEWKAEIERRLQELEAWRERIKQA